METKFKLLGHPVHPMLIVFPLGLFSTAVIFDLLYLVTGNEDLAIFSFWAIAAGVIGAIAAAVFGTWDYLAIPDNTRAKRIGLMHGGGNAVFTALFASDIDANLDASSSLSSSGVVDVERPT